MYVCVRLLFDNALQGAVAGVLDDNYETRTRFSPFLCTCVFYTCSLPYWLVCHQNRLSSEPFLCYSCTGRRSQRRNNCGVDLIAAQKESQCRLNLSAEAVRLNTLAESIVVQNQSQL